MHTVTIVVAAIFASGCTRSIQSETWVEENSIENYAVNDLPERTEPPVTDPPDFDPPRAKSTVTVMLRSNRAATHHQARAQRTRTEVIVDSGPDWPPLETYALADVKLVRVDGVQRKRVMRT